jgi:hypothetical protein
VLALARAQEDQPREPSPAVLSLAQAMEDDLAAAPEMALAAIGEATAEARKVLAIRLTFCPIETGRDGPGGPGTHDLCGWPESEHLPIEDPDGSFLEPIAAEMCAAQDTLDAAGIALTALADGSLVPLTQLAPPVPVRQPAPAPPALAAVHPMLSQPHTRRALHGTIFGDVRHHYRVEGTRFAQYGAAPGAGDTLSNQPAPPLPPPPEQDGRRSTRRRRRRSR